MTTQTLIPSPTHQLVETTLQKHHQYLQQNNYAGWDVFDGLNSILFQRLPFHNNRLTKLFWIQLFKKSPINFRQFAGVPKSHNPKALALFISGLINLARYYENDQYIEEALQLSQKLLSFKSKGYAGSGWGYDFPWQARVFYVPAFKPNMVVSTFVGQALLDLHEVTAETCYLDEAEKIAGFMRQEMAMEKENSSICFRYVPGEDAVIHNVNLLGAAFLSRLFAVTVKRDYQYIAEESVRYSVNAQRSDGAWVYGKKGYHQWVDNFHTGYNLVSIYAYQQFCGDNQFESSIANGVAFHRNQHFTNRFIPKYSDISLYPIDIHCYAQAIISAITLRNYWQDYRDFLTGIVQNVINSMYDASGQYFYYQRHKHLTNKIPYIRWSQAWMFYALTKYLTSNIESNTT